MFKQEAILKFSYVNNPHINWYDLRLQILIELLGHTKNDHARKKLAIGINAICKEYVR